MDPDIVAYLQSLEGFPSQIFGEQSAGYQAAVMPSQFGSGTYTPPPANTNVNNLIVREQYGNTGAIAAADTMGNIVRRQYDDYLRRFAPIENMLHNDVMNNGAGLQQDMGRTQGAILGAAANQQGQFARNQQRYGLSAQGPDANDSLSTVGSLVGGLRDTRMRARDRQMSVLGGASNISTQTKRDIGGLN